MAIERIKKRLEDERGVVFDIQRYSLHDGPGLRTNVFLKGCALSCMWCSNPESLLPSPQVAFFSKNCFLCGDCLPVCEPNAIRLENNELRWNVNICNHCGLCAAVCPARAFKMIGQEITAGEVIAEVLRDAAFFAGGGGLTLSGGEPALQPDFSAALLELAKTEGLHTSIETCGAVPWNCYTALLPYLDFLLFDIKHINPKIHAQYTGRENSQILENARLAANSGIEMVVRVPLIPGFNDQVTVLLDIANFVISLGTVKEIHLLPYHTLGKAKYKALEKPYLLDSTPPMPVSQAEQLAGTLRQIGLAIKVGG